MTKSLESKIPEPTEAQTAALARCANTTEESDFLAEDNHKNFRPAEAGRIANETTSSQLHNCVNTMSTINMEKNTSIEESNPTPPQLGELQGQAAPVAPAEMDGVWHQPEHQPTQTLNVGGQQDHHEERTIDVESTATPATPAAPGREEPAEESHPAAPDQPVVPRPERPTDADPGLKVGDYRIHPLALAFPPASEEDLAALAHDISANGLLHSIVLYEGMILDGRSRAIACSRTGVPLRTEPLRIGASPIDYVVAANLRRRQLTPAQRAIVAANLMPHYQAQAAARKRVLAGTRANPDGSTPQVPERIREAGQPGEACEKAAQATGTNPRYVIGVVKLKSQAPDLFRAVASGTMTIPRAMKKLETQRAERPDQEPSPQRSAVTVVLWDSSESKASRAPEKTYNEKTYPNMVFCTLHQPGDFKFGDCSKHGLAHIATFAAPVETTQLVTDKGGRPFCKVTCCFLTMAVRGSVPEPAVVPGQIIDGGYDGVVKMITSMFPAALKVVSTTRPEAPKGWEHVPRQAPVDAKTMSLDRIHPKYRPVWEAKSQADREALSKYFLPLGSQKPLLRPTSRPKLIKWYCPGADQNVFPSGHRYEINVFYGCGHFCVYCFVGPAGPKPKRDFEKLLRKDLENLERFNVPPAPVHMSNSTDPFQPLESKYGHTKFALEGLLRYRHRFTTVTLTTKNPLLAAQGDYLSLLQSLGKIAEDHPARELFLSGERPACQVEVSMAFWREEARDFWDPKAPTLEERKEGMRKLRAARVPVVLRIDPLFPRSPITTEPLSSLSDFHLVEAQTLDDLEQLVSFAKEIGVHHIVYKVVKIISLAKEKGERQVVDEAGKTVPPVEPPMRRLKRAFEAIARPEELVFRGGSWRLPRRHVDLIADPFLEICNRHGVPAKFCIKNVLEIP